ncbi:type II secretion system protein GspL [Microbulbifer bruguierae]|uniref:Type II secretion system protein L n=1 Tax=Microbulbifer bruguierae TaxID=3029061 RepID=A0ABY8NFH7_9GAMM|nr:type II secretion system protein GspL [Microbulbifer bruguierae]WGL17149.1 type II secretion system protein GspL [Microbulbifer bruguierae]
MSQDLKLLRLRDNCGISLECWGEGAWHPVATDQQFRRAFHGGASDAEYELDSSPVGPVDVAETGEAGDIDSLSFEPGQRAVILLPGSWVWNGLEMVPRAARRQSSAVGYMVEDQLAEDVDDLHFVCEPITGDLCSVMAVATDKLRALKVEIERRNWPVVTAIPEYRLLAGAVGESAIWLEDDRAHFWQGAGRGLSVGRTLAGVVAESLFVPGDLDEAPASAAAATASDDAETSASLRVYGVPTELELATLQQLGQVESVGEMPESRWLNAAPGVIPGNLLSGPFQIVLQTGHGPWWKRPLIAVAACFVAQLLFFLAAGGYYSFQASQADKAARQLFTDIFPGDSPSADLRRQVNGYLNQSSGGGGEFASQLQQLSQVWGTGSAGDLKLQSLRFDGNRGELVLQLRAPSLSQLDTVVNKLSSGQFKAELLAANELEDGVSGRIRLR